MDPMPVEYRLRALDLAFLGAVRGGSPPALKAGAAPPPFASDPFDAAAEAPRMDAVRRCVNVRIDVTARAPPDGVLEAAEVRRGPSGWEFASAWIAGRIDADLSCAEVACGSAPFAFATVARTVLALDVVARGGLVLHSVALGERASGLFVGHSGAGKSTLGALCAANGLPLLSDELVAVLPWAGKYLAHATPWNVGGDRCAPLAMLGTLVHDREHRVERCPPSEVLRVLVQNVLLPERSAESRARAFRAAVAMAGAVQTVRLRFARDTGVAVALKAALDC